MHRLCWEPLCEPNFHVFLYYEYHRDGRVKLAGRKSALKPHVVYSADHSKAMIPVLILLFVALLFILRGDLF